MTLGQIKEATCAPTAAAIKFAEYINATCLQFDISTPIRQLCFLAQVGHESGGLFYTEELASGKAYENRLDLGNTVPGDGVRYKGRGLIQITGRSNYTALSHALGTDFVTDPALLGGKNVNKCNPGQLRYASLSAGWFWASRRLNDIADLIDINKSIDSGKNLEHYKNITRKINGGYNGLPDRLHRYKCGHKFFVGAPVA